ncbi:MAG: phosphoribosylamine--glycine ligase, partial [Desulfobulbus sp.]|nr:phosphoribosylamine--glycine ligase [Desulfobulbus sp.]
MKVLVIGGGGREHALVWKLRQSSQVDAIYCAPGNAGIRTMAQCIDISAGNIDALLDFALQEKIDLTIVGPEEPLTKGVVDLFEK